MDRLHLHGAHSFIIVVMFWLTNELNGIVLFVSARWGPLSWTKKETHIWVMMMTARINRLFSELNSNKNDVNAASLSPTHTLACGRHTRPWQWQNKERSRLVEVWPREKMSAVARPTPTRPLLAAERRRQWRPICNEGADRSRQRVSGTPVATRGVRD